MSVRKLTISASVMLTASLLSAFALGLYGNAAAMAAAGAVSLVSLGALLRLVFGRLYPELIDTAGNFKEVLASMPMPAIELDANGNVVAVNNAALRIGVPPSAMGRPLAGLEEVVNGARSGLMGLPVQGEDGSTLRLLVSATPLKKNGEPAGAVLIGKDDTRKLEAELEEVKAEARAVETKLNGTIRELEEFALMAVRRETKMKQIREKLTELNERRDTSGGNL